MIISFAWTTDALLAGRKKVTRRDWKTFYAARFLKGTVHSAYDRLPRTGKGKKVGDIEILKQPYIERTRDIPDDDFEGEGLKFMEEKGLLIRGITPQEWFDRWRSSDQVLFVVRFRLVFPCDRCGEYTDDSTFGPGDRQRLCPHCWVDWIYHVDANSTKAKESDASWKKLYAEFLADARPRKGWPK